jgi:hypothetical protein
MIKIDEGLYYALISKEFKITALYDSIYKILRIYKEENEINRFNLKENRLANSKAYLLIKKMKRFLKKKSPARSRGNPN